MYICRHCGLEYKTDEAVICPRCQAPKGKGTNFCPFCGEQVTPEQKICVNCGVEMETYGIGGVKSKVAAGLLGIFFGAFGVHNFYLCYYKRAAVQLGLVIFSYVIFFAAMIGAMTADPYAYYASESASIGLLIVLLLYILIIIGVRIWTFVESIFIFCGKINKDGKGRLLK